MTRNTTAALAAILLASAAPLPLALPFAPTAAQAQSVVTFDNLGFKSDIGAVSIPKIMIEGTNATKADIEGLFDTKASATVAERLSRISARSISIPVIEIRQSVGETESVTTYRDTTFRNVANGVIGEASMTSWSVKGKGARPRPSAPSVDIDVAGSSLSIKSFDLALMLRAFFTKGGANEPLKTVATEQTIGRTVMKVGNDVSIVIAGASIRDFKMRALATPFTEIMAETKKNETEKKPGWEQRNLVYASQMLSMFALGTMEMTGLTAQFKDPASGAPGSMALDKVSMSGQSLMPERFSMQGMKVDASGAKVQFGEITFSGMDFSSMISALQKVGDGQKMEDADPTQFIPKIGLMRFAGIDIDAPDAKSPGQRVKARLGLFETTMANHVGAIPADIAVTLDRLQMDIPANTREKGLQDILKLGYKALDISGRYDQKWQEASKTLRLNEFSLKSAGMFAATAKAEIGNVTREVFNTDKAVAAVAALGVSARSVDLAVVNDSLVEKLIAQQAREARRKVEDVKAEMAAGAALMIPMFLGDHPGAKVLGATLGKFIANPKNVKVTLTAKDGGVGAPDFIASGNPMDVLKKVDITSSANE